MDPPKNLKSWNRSSQSLVQSNNMIISWLLNSLSRKISESVIYYSTAKDIWAELEDRFGQSSGQRIFQLQKELSDLVQGSSILLVTTPKSNDSGMSWILRTPSAFVLVTVPVEQRRKILKPSRMSV
ncbi:hypothetical protein RDI58_000619 [Solanum bulbocastanum]|uniref:Retrotransposon Copia-like N-terminal domain-containing protein n=1 Tax=Solanum bulbocastanum TaxID=147425 RepID=A0AAN8UAH1_SOLBU